MGFDPGRHPAGMEISDLKGKRRKQGFPGAEMLPDLGVAKIDDPVEDRSQIGRILFFFSILDNHQQIHGMVLRQNFRHVEKSENIAAFIGRPRASEGDHQDAFCCRFHG